MVSFVSRSSPDATHFHMQSGLNGLRELTILGRHRFTAFVMQQENRVREKLEDQEKEEARGSVRKWERKRPNGFQLLV